MKTGADDHSGRDAGKQGWVRRRSKCGTATEEMWDYGDSKMGWKDGNGLVKYQQITTTKLSEYRHSNNLGVGGDDGPAHRFGIHLETVCLIL